MSHDEQLQELCGDVLEQIEDDHTPNAAVTSSIAKPRLRVIGVPYVKAGMSVDGGDFELMIENPAFRSCLFLFNGNQKDDNRVDPKSGSGSAIIRPYSTMDAGYRSASIPTGWAPGIPFATVEDDQVRMAIDDAFQKIASVVHMKQYDTVFFACESKVNRKSIGSSTFVLAPDVVEYINKRLESFAFNYESCKVFIPIVYINSRTKYYKHRITREVESMKRKRHLEARSTFWEQGSRASSSSSSQRLLTSDTFNGFTINKRPRVN